MKLKFCHCRTCGSVTKHDQPGHVGIVAGILLTMLTCGLWLPFWMLQGLRPYRCLTCGRKRGFLRLWP